VSTVAQWVLLGLDAVFPTCLGYWDFYSNLLLQLVLPIAIIPFIIFMIYLFSLVDPETLHKCIGFGFLFLDLSYTGLVLNSFQVFACQLATNGNSYLYAAPVEQCYTPKHQTMMILSSLILVTIGIGYPLALLLLTTKWIAKTNEMKKRTLHLYGFAFDIFKFRFNYWSFIQLVRNFVTCAVAALLIKYPGEQGALLLMITSIHIVVIMKYKPFISQESSQLESIVALIELGVITIGFLFGSDYIPHLDAILLERCLVLILLGYPLLILFVVCQEIFDHNVSQGTRKVMIEFSRKVDRISSFSNSNSNSSVVGRQSPFATMKSSISLAKQDVNLSNNNSSHHKQKSMFQDCLRGIIAERYVKGKEGKEDEDALYHFVNCFSPRELNAWAHDMVREREKLHTCAIFANVYVHRCLIHVFMNMICVTVIKVAYNLQPPPPPHPSVFIYHNIFFT
jgi:hypothetical protein